MSEIRPQVLIVEDESDLLEYYTIELESEANYDIHTAETVREAQKKLSEREFDVVLADLKLRAAEIGGLEILEKVKTNTPDTQVIIFTGIGGTDDARQAERLRADGYLTKPLDFDRVRQVIHNAIAVRQQRREARDLVRGRREKEFPTPESFIAGCQVMRDLVNAAARIAGNSSHVLIIGEIGTGKSLLAEGIHLGSKRVAFELVNCGGLAERTLERIVFGHYDGETGVYSSGLLERLNGGTLVMDRITSLSLRLQEKLLTVLTSGRYQPHESVAPISVALRVIALEEMVLQEAVAQGLFLRDLASLLATEVLTVPPLRERRDADGRYRDVLILAEHFIKKYSTTRKLADSVLPTLLPEAEYILENYPFPGNVRELERTIRVIIGTLSSDAISPKHFPASLRRYSAQVGMGEAQKNPPAPVLCPHGGFYCNQVATIAKAYHTTRGLYIRLSKDLNADSQRRIIAAIEKQGLAAFQPEQIKEPLTPMCGVCIPIQACHFAIIDIDHADGQVFYEIGLMHALGIPTLIFRPHQSVMPDRFDKSAVVGYSTTVEIEQRVITWLMETL